MGTLHLPTKSRKAPTERQEDSIFWDRLADMPAWEAEQECVSRREQLVLEKDMMISERGRLGECQDSHAMGLAIIENNAQLTKLNERIKYLRKLQHHLQWKEAVRELFGQEAYEQCIVWIELHYQEQLQKRREWSS